MAEYIFDAQVNAGWGLSLNMTGKAPAVAKRIFATYADALDYVNNFNDSAIPGLQLSVINDTDDTKNGIYFVSKIGTKAADGSRANDGVLVKDSGSGAISVSTYAEALTKIKVDATTQEVKNLGQVIYVKTATGTVGLEDYKAAGAYVVTGATSLEKLGTTSASGDFSTDIANLRTDLGNLSNTVDGIDEAVDNINDVKIPEVEKAIEDLDGVVIKNVMLTMGGPVLTPDKDGTIVFTWETDITKNSTVPPTTGTVKDALATKVSSIKSGSAEAVTPVDGVATITYDAVLNDSSTNAPQTKTVWAAYNSISTQVSDLGKRSKLSILTPDTISDASVLKRYVFYQGRDAQDPTNTPGTVVGTIDIPKDLVVTSGELVIGDGNNGTTLGVQYLKLNIGNGEPVYIKVGDLVDAYVEGAYLSISEGNVLSVDIDAVDTKLAEDASAVGGRIKAVEEDVANVVSHTDEELGKLVADRLGSLSTLVKKNKDAIKTLNDVISVPGSVANKTFELVEDLIDGSVELNGSKSSLYLVAQNANSALQEIESANENQLTIAVENNVATLTPVTVSSDELVKIGTEEEVEGSTEKLLTAGVAKAYIDSLWEWEIIS